MTRLFLSLYLFLMISIIILGYGLDKLLFSNPQPSSPSQQAFLTVLKTYQSQPEQLKEIMQSSHAQITSMKLGQFSETNISNSLKQDKIVDGLQDGKWTIYVPTQNNEVLVARFENESLPHTPLVLYTALFFGLLGIALAFWVFPLGKDLKKLSVAANTLKTDGTLSIPAISGNSPLRPLVLAYESLNQNIKNLLKQQKALAGAITHEFKTPIARLKFALESAGDYSHEQISAIKGDINELENLVQEMLDFSKLDSQEPNLHIEDIPLFEFCRSCIANFQTQTSISINLTGDSPNILADSSLLKRALENLLTNAIRHARTQICVSIQINQTLVIQVEDDGLGISSKDAPHIFEVFYRTDSHRSRCAGGTGLGLAIVERVMRWHQGNVSVSSSTLGGAKFSLIFSNKVIV